MYIYIVGINLSFSCDLHEIIRRKKKKNYWIKMSKLSRLIISMHLLCAYLSQIHRFVVINLVNLFLLWTYSACETMMNGHVIEFEENKKRKECVIDLSSHSSTEQEKHFCFLWSCLWDNSFSHLSYIYVQFYVLTEYNVVKLQFIFYLRAVPFSGYPVVHIIIKSPNIPPYSFFFFVFYHKNTALTSRLSIIWN